MLESTCLVTSLHLVHAKMVNDHSQKMSTRKIFLLYIQQGPIIYPSFKDEEVSHLIILLKVCTFLGELGLMKHTLLPFVHFSIKLKRFLNII